MNFIIYHNLVNKNFVMICTFALLGVILILIVICTIMQYNYIPKETGFTIIKSLINKEKIDMILKKWEQKKYSEIKDFFLTGENSDKIREKIKNILGKDYILIDYCYLIENSAIHTYHRDYTSSMNYNNLNHPSYTMILYLDNSDTGLNLIPGSHNDNISIYLVDKSEKLNFDAGTAILFNADVLHAGTASDGNVSRHCIQFKIIHKDDLNKMPWLDNFHVLINRPNNKSLIMKTIESNLTKHLPIFMDNTQDLIKSAFSEDRTPIQKFISSLIFSNEDFYKPIRIL